MNTNMTNNEIEASERQLDNWMRLEWSNQIAEITERYADINDVTNAILESLTTAYDKQEEDEYERIAGLLADAIGEADGTPDGNFTGACFAMWRADKEWFRDNERVYEDICKELLLGGDQAVRS